MAESPETEIANAEERRKVGKSRWKLLAVLVAGMLLGAVLTYALVRVPSPVGSGQAGEGPRLREFFISSGVTTWQIASGVTIDAWAYNATVPGPTIRVTEGDTVRVTFTNNHVLPHSIHFHGIRDDAMDGMEPVNQSQTRVYEFIARPAGTWLYHCHVAPVSDHMRMGLYGAFIIDPLAKRATAHEEVLVLSEWSTTGDMEPEFHVFNGVVNRYVDAPLQVNLGELVRFHLLNLGFEFHTFHLHANVYTVYPSGTGGGAYVTDTYTLGPGETAMIEFTYEYPGTYPFHCHVVPHAEMGMLGLLQVT